MEQIIGNYKGQALDQSAISQLLLRIEEKRKELGPIYYLAVIMAYGSCRIGECLAISWGDIASNGSVFIHGSKGSRSKLVTAPGAIEYLQKCKKNQMQPFKHLTRKTVWYQFKKHGLYIQKKGRRYQTVTHIFRNANADQIRSMGKNEIGVRDILGHNSKSNTQYYGKHQKESK